MTKKYLINRNTQYRQMNELLRLLTYEFSPILKQEFKRFYSEIATSLGASGQYNNNLIKKHKDKLNKILEKMIYKSIKISALRQKEILKTLTKKELPQSILDFLDNDEIVYTNEKEKDHVLRNALILAALLTRTSENEVTMVISNGLFSGLTKDDIVDKINEQLVEIRSELRAEIVAESTIHGELEYGAIEETKVFAEENNFVLKKEWIHHPEESNKPRESHAEADGQTVEVDDSFIVDGEELEFPGDPNGSPENIINCHCTTIFVQED